MRRIICVILVCVLLACPSRVSAAPPSVSARSAILLNASTGGVIAEFGGYERLPMASTTKIMTALILAEQPDLNKTIVTTREMVTVEGSSMGLQVGDTVSYHDLLYGMLLASGNDAANTTAIALAGSVEQFAVMMNEKAAELGLRDTHFVTPSGLDDAEHYTTAYDLGQLAIAALENPVFLEAASSRSAKLCYGNPPYDRTLSNHNKLLSMYDGCIGVKTGFTKKSGRCLVSAAERDGVRLVAVTLNDGDDWNDHQKLLDYGFDTLQKVRFTPEIPTTTPVVGGEAATVSLQVQSVELPLLPQDLPKVRQEVYINQILYAPLNAGEVVGRVELYYDERPLASVNITAGEQVACTPPRVINKDLFYFIKLLLCV